MSHVTRFLDLPLIKVSANNPKVCWRMKSITNAILRFLKSCKKSIIYLTCETLHPDFFGENLLSLDHWKDHWHFSWQPPYLAARKKTSSRYSFRSSKKEFWGVKYLTLLSLLHSDRTLAWVKTERDGTKFTIGKYYINAMEITKLFPIKFVMSLLFFPWLTISLF